MTPNEFHDYLRNLQKNLYNWPNDYFAWEKPDGTLFMVGIRSGLFSDILKYQYEQQFNDYCVHLYGIHPDWVYMKYVPDGSKDGKNVPHDPVETLSDEIQNYKYIGSWRDPDALMPDPGGYGLVHAHGRWELAKEHILAKDRAIPLTEKLKDAQERAAKDATAQYVEDRLNLR